MRKILLIIWMSFVIVFGGYGQDKEDKTLLLKIGEKSLKDKILNISAGEIYSAKEGKAIPFSKMIAEMKKSRFVYVGESHNSLPMHNIQDQIIKALFEQDQNLSIGVEMFPVTFQEALNKWTLGILSRDEFMREAKWYINWSMNYGFYERIFQFAKEKRIPIRALNVPRSLISKIRMKGWDALTEDEKKIAPRPDLSHEEHRMLIKTIFESAELPHQMKGEGLEMMFEGLYRAQSAWDEAMAFHACQMSHEGRKMVILAGSGHLLYNLGINLRVFEKNRFPFKTVIAIEVPKDKKNIQVSRSLADYVYGIAEEDRPAFPSIGLKFKKVEGLENLIVETKPIDGVALDSDFEKGDIILSVDEKGFSDINELRIYLAQFKWDEEVKFRLLRNANEFMVVLKFQTTEKIFEEK